MADWNLSDDFQWQNFCEMRRQAVMCGKRFIVRVMPAKRSLSQNDMSFALYKQIAEQREDESIEEVRLRCKLEHGVPILRRDDEEFRYVYDNSLKKLNYAQKLIAMKWTDVTSKFSKGQFSEYLDEVIRVHSMQGICLVHPSEMDRAA